MRRVECFLQTRPHVRSRTRKDGLRLTAAGLAAALPDETAALQRLIGEAAATTNGHRTEPGGAILLTRPSMRPPLALSVSPMPKDALVPGLAGSAAVAVFVVDPEGATGADASLLGRLYGLTRAETRIADGLLQGSDLRETAESLGVSYHTARSQSKSIYAKTGTRGQADLMRLLLQLPSQGRNGD